MEEVKRVWPCEQRSATKSFHLPRTKDTSFLYPTNELSRTKHGLQSKRSSQPIEPFSKPDDRINTAAPDLQYHLSPNTQPRCRSSLSSSSPWAPPLSPPLSTAPPPQTPHPHPPHTSTPSKLAGTTPGWATPPPRARPANSWALAPS